MTTVQLIDMVRRLVQAGMTRKRAIEEVANGYMVGIESLAALCVELGHNGHNGHSSNTNKRSK